MSADLQAGLDRARAWAASASPEDREAMRQAQRASWARGEAAMGESSVVVHKSPPAMNYVVGFLFDEDRESIALIEKRKGPRDMAGKLNGIGGKIEAGETPLQAMEREFGEEAGVGGIEWEHVAELRGPDFKLHVFAGFSVNILFVRSMEAEQVAVYDIPSVLGGVYPLMPNLPTLITLALDQSGIVKPVLLFDGVCQERAAA